MAKPFYSLEEVSARLGKSEDEIRALVRDGALREFRDAGKIFFKAEDIEKLAAASTPGAGGSGSAMDITLEPADEELPTLADIKGGTSVLGLQPLEDEPDKADKKGGTVISTSGIGVFDEDELEIEADPMADTQVTTGASDQVSLEGTGGGSGLLDLTREADDTSLGAELLDEIYPGEEETQPAAPPPRRTAPVAAQPAEEESTEEEEEQAEETAYAPASYVVATGDPTEGMFSGMLVGAVLLLLVSGAVVAGALQGYMPSYARILSENFWFFLGGAALLVILSLLIGWLLGRSGSAPRRVAAK